MIKKLTAKDYFEKVYEEAGTARSKSTLLNVRKACDSLVAMKADLNYSQVGRYATEHFEGPKIQSIRNNEKLKTYISLRLDEYESTTPKASAKKKSTVPLSYPVADLDLKTKAYIDQLKQELEIVSRENKNLSSMLTDATRKTPISLAEIQSADNKVDAYLAIEAVEPQGKLSEEMISALKKVIDLPNTTTEFAYRKKRGQKEKMLMHESPSGETVFLNVAEMNAIDETLTDG